VEQVVEVRAAGVPTIAVNDAYLLAPFADLVYFADAKWWRWHKDRPEWRAFAGQKCSIDVGHDPKMDQSIHLLTKSHEPGISLDPAAICTGSNSGYQAINIAILAGAKRIVLIGYDGQPKGGRHHFFGEHPDKSFAPYDVIRVRFLEAVEPARAAGVEILNASPDSRIDCFPMVTLADGLQRNPRSALV
jgi:hypothetical protein